LRKWKEKACQV